MKVKNVSWIALFAAFSAVGAMIKIPAVIGSVALDALPALLAAVLLGAGPGALVAAVGHLLSALLGGMPLGPFHFMIAIEMAFLVWFFGVLFRGGKRLTGSSMFVLGNAFAAPLPFMFLMSKAFYISIVPSLLIGSILNVGLALMAIPRLKVIFKSSASKKEIQS